MSATQSFLPCNLKNSLTSTFKSKKRLSTFPFDNQRTSVWYKSVLWSAFILRHRFWKSRVFKALDLIWLTIFIATRKTHLWESGNVLDANASLCIIQWFPMTCGADSLTCFMKPERQPSIAGAPSVHIAKRFSYLRPSCSINECSFLYMSIPRVCESRCSQNRNSSLKSDC